jgi:hypothetical protein
MNIIEQWEDLTLDRLLPPDGQTRLGIVMGFVADSNDYNRSSKIVMESFAYGASQQGYNVLFINNFDYLKQPRENPRPVAEDDNICNIYIPWFKSLREQDSHEPLAILEAFTHAYDFVIIGSEHKGGLYNLDEHEKSGRVDLEVFFDKFVFPCSTFIPEHLRNRSVTYVPTYVTDTNLYPILSVDENFRISGRGMTAQGNLSFFNYAERRTFKARYPDILPVVSAHVDCPPLYQKITFGALLGLLSTDLLYVNKQVLEAYDAPPSSVLKKGWYVGGSVFGATNVIGAGLALAFHSFTPIAFFAVASVATGMLAADKGMSKKSRQLTQSDTVSALIEANPYVPSKVFPLTRAEKPFLALPVSPKAKTEQPQMQKVHTAPRREYNYSPKIDINTTQKAYRQAVKRYNRVRDAWLTYETDMLKFLDAPLMRDLTVETTAKFFATMDHTNHLLESIMHDEENGAPMDAELVEEFKDSVADMHIAFEQAEAYASYTGVDHLDEKKRKDFATAAQMLKVSQDESASPSERAAALTQGRKMLNKAVRVPKGIYGILEGNIPMIEAR